MFSHVIFVLKFFPHISQWKQVLCDFQCGKYIWGKALSNVWKEVQDEMLHDKTFENKSLDIF